MNFFISLNRLYNKYKLVIWFGIAFIIIFALISLYSGKARKQMAQDGDFVGNATTVYNTVNKKNEIIDNIETGDWNNKTDNEITEDINKVISSGISGQDLIEIFIESCNSKNFNYAYGMLSDDCKSVLYPTKEDFINSYYSPILQTNKKYSVKKYKNNTYKVDYSEGRIAANDNYESKITDYITIDSNTRKINISKLIGKEDIKKSASNSYISVNVTERIIYFDYEVYIVNVKNNTKADIYLNNIDNSNLYIKNSSNVKFNIANDEYSNNDYYIGSEKEKNISLKFYRSYDESNDIKTMNLEHILIKNKLYYDSTKQIIDPNSGDITYESKTTNYPEQSELVIYF